MIATFWNYWPWEPTQGGQGNGVEQGDEMKQRNGLVLKLFNSNEHVNLEMGNIYKWEYYGFAWKFND